MARETAFVKVSGDLCRSHKFIGGLQKLSQRFFVVVCVGGGTQINEAFEKVGFDVLNHGPLGRELKTFQQRQLARNVLEENQVALQDLLAENGIVATVIIPVLEIGSVLCHVNGDEMVRTVYNGFDHLFIATTPERRVKKAEEFRNLPKVEVLAFD